MTARGLILNNIKGLSKLPDSSKDSMDVPLIARTWKKEKLTEPLISREYRLAKEEKIRAAKGLFYGGLLSVMLWFAIASGFYILF